jgi:hypothetical protein
MANNVFKVDNGLTVSGGDLRVVNANAVELRANTTIAADASVSANLTVSGNTSLAKTTISGNFLPTANGRVIGDTTATFDTFTGNNIVSGYLNPTSNGISLGSTSAQWDVNARTVIAANAIVVAGVVTINSLGVSATTTNANNVFGLTTTGIVVRTGAAAGTTRTITGGNTVTITNGDGVLANPTLSIPLQSGLFSNSQGVFVNASSVAVGQLPITYGGTGSTSAFGAFTNIVAGGVSVNTSASAYSYILSTDNAGNYVWAAPNPPPDTAANILTKIKTVDGSGSGLDADTLDGWDSATAATANTVAVRDASGYLYATYLNQSSALEVPTIASVFVNNGTDNFLRKISNTNFVSGLSLATVALNNQAYSNAVSYAGSIAATAYSNAVSYAGSIAATAYSNATVFAANAGNINNGTLAEARLPYRMDQSVRTTDTVTFGNMTVSGNLTVSGTTTYINTTTLNVGDNIITLNADHSGAPTQDAGFEVNRGTSATVSFVWDETNDRWTLGSQNLVAGTFIGALTGNVTGNVSGSAGTLQTARNINGTSFNGSADITTATWGTARNITIGGTTKSVNGNADYNWTLAEIGAYSATNPNSYTSNLGTVTSVATGTGLTGGTITTTGTISLASGVIASPGTYSSGISSIVVDTYGRVTSVTGSAGYVTSSGVTSVGTGTGLTGGTITSTGTISLASGVIASPGTYSSGISAITVDTYGRVTGVSGSAGYSTTTGTLTSVTVSADNGLTGGGTLTGAGGTLNLSVGAGNYIIVNSDNIAVDSTSLNVASKVVNRDSSGNFSAGTITATLSGTATNVSGTVAIGNGGTGSTTAAGARGNLGGTTVGQNFFTLTNPGAIRFPRINADNSVSALSDSAFRTAIGATTVGGNFFTLTNPSAVTFPRINADNTVSTLSAADFRTAIGAGTSSTTGTVTSVAAGSYLTGGTITTTGTLAVDATTTATASKVAARDSSANIYANDFFATSDARLKKDIVEIQNALATIEKISGVQFKWNELASDPNKEKVQVGVIAQEVEAVAPEIVSTNEDGFKSVSYDKLVPLLIQAVKELSEKVKQLEGK